MNKSLIQITAFIAIIFASCGGSKPDLTAEDSVSQQEKMLQNCNKKGKDFICAVGIGKATHEQTALEIAMSNANENLEKQIKSNGSEISAKAEIFETKVIYDKTKLKYTVLVSVFNFQVTP